MKDNNRTGVLIGLALLFGVLLLVVPQIDFFRPLRHVSPWLIFAIFWVIFWGWGGCCGRRRCCRRRHWRYEDESAEADD